MAGTHEPVAILGIGATKALEQQGTEPKPAGAAR
jgi:hypothetical protein